MFSPVHVQAWLNRLQSATTNAPSNVGKRIAVRLVARVVHRDLRIVLERPFNVPVQGAQLHQIAVRRRLAPGAVPEMQEVWLVNPVKEITKGGSEFSQG